MNDSVVIIGVAVVSAIGTGLTTWGALRVELRWLWAEVKRAHHRLDQIDRRRA